MNKIVLNDGTEIENGLISVSGIDQILVTVPGTDIVHATLTFSDPNKTSEMICYSSVYKFTYTGYNRITSLNVSILDNCVRIYMTGDNVSKDTEYTFPEEYLPEEMRTGADDNV